MITSEQSEKLKKIIGPRPGVVLNLYFIENNILNRKGEPFTTSMITRVLSGKVQHTKIEESIVRYVEHIQVERAALEARKQEVLSNV